MHTQSSETETLEEGIQGLREGKGKRSWRLSLECSQGGSIGGLWSLEEERTFAKASTWHA